MAETVAAWKVPATSEFPTKRGPLRHMWIENGTERHGLEHMQGPGKIKAFEVTGIQASEQRQTWPVLVEAHTTVDRHIGYQGSGDTRPIIATQFEGRVVKGAVTVGNNGYVVGLNPKSTLKANDRLRTGPPEVSDRTMQDHYYYPANCPTRREMDPM